MVIFYCIICMYMYKIITNYHTNIYTYLLEYSQLRYKGQVNVSSKQPQWLRKITISHHGLENKHICTCTYDIALCTCIHVHHVHVKYTCTCIIQVHGHIKYMYILYMYYNTFIRKLRNVS